MERLTESVLGNVQLKACGNDFCKETCVEHDEEKSCNNCPIQKAFKRLAEYENLGITPDQIKELDKRYTEKCGQIKEIVKRLEKEAEEARAGGDPEISGAYIRSIYIIKEIAEGRPELTDDKRIDLVIEKSKV